MYINLSNFYHIYLPVRMYVLLGQGFIIALVVFVHYFLSSKRKILTMDTNIFIELMNENQSPSV